MIMGESESKTYSIEAPNKDYQGTVGPVQFVDGKAETDNIQVVRYCIGAGYTVNGVQDHEPNTGQIVPTDPRELGTNGDGVEIVGTRLRDAAVNPKDVDFLGPTNAGQEGELGNPHGPHVVNPEIHGSVDQAVLPGPVGRVETAEDGQSKVIVSDPEEQERRETEFAERTLVGDENVTTVSVEMGEAAGVPEPTPEAVAEETKALQDETWANREDDGKGDGTTPVESDANVQESQGDQPKGNASREEWAEWASRHGASDEETQEGGFTRDQLRDQYGNRDQG